MIFPFGGLRRIKQSAHHRIFRPGSEPDCGAECHEDRGSQPGGCQCSPGGAIQPQMQEIFTKMHKFTAVHRGRDYIARSDSELQ